jgi:hypothetical protein
MQPATTKPFTTQNPIHKGAKVTFKGFPEPVMNIDFLDWASNAAICRYRDPLAQKFIRLNCDPNDLAPVKTDKT